MLLSLPLLRSLSIAPSLISVTIQMLTFKATSHADWLTGWQIRREKRGQGRRRGWRRDGEESLSLSIKIGKILLSSPFTSLSPSCRRWMSSPISPEGSQISLVLRKAEPSHSRFVCLFTHLPLPTPTSLFTVRVSTPFFVSLLLWVTIQFGARGAHLKTHYKI